MENSKEKNVTELNENESTDQEGSVGIESKEKDDQDTNETTIDAASGRLNVDTVHFKILILSAILVFCLCIVYGIYINEMEGFVKIKKDYFISFSFILIPVVYSFSYVIYLWTKNHLQQIHLTSSETASIEQKVDEVLSSANFFRALQEVIPKEDQDEQNGLSYIPFLLTNVRKKKERYELISKYFLIGTIASGLLFSLVLLYFGNILIEDDSVGYNRRLVELDEKVSETVINIDEDLLTAKDKISEIKNDLKGLGFSSLLETRSYQKDIDSLALGLSINNIDTIRGNLVLLRSSVGKINISRDSTVNYDATVKILSNSKNKLSEVISDMGKIYASYYINKENFIENLEQVQKMAKELSEKDIPENFAIGEIFKRFFIGVVIASFFLAILRFMSKQYTENYNRTLLADEEESSIRRFYVAYKASSSENEKVAAISKLLDIKGVKEIFRESDIKALDNSMLQSILSKLADKL